MERSAATTLKGNPFTVLGPELKAGDKSKAQKDFDSLGKDTTAPQAVRQRAAAMAEALGP